MDLREHCVIHEDAAHEREPSEPEWKHPRVPDFAYMQRSYEGGAGNPYVMLPDRPCACQARARSRRLLRCPHRSVRQPPQPPLVVGVELLAEPALELAVDLGTRALDDAEDLADLLPAAACAVLSTGAPAAVA